MRNISIASDGSIFTVTSDQTNDILIPFYFGAEQQELNGAGAVQLTQYYTAWTTTGANAGTLADGLVKGQMKKIQLIVDAGDGSLTIANDADNGANAIWTFADAGDYIKLIWNGTAWQVLEIGNDADGATQPVVS